MGGSAGDGGEGSAVHGDVINTVPMHGQRVGDFISVAADLYRETKCCRQEEPHGAKYRYMQHSNVGRVSSKQGTGVRCRDSRRTGSLVDFSYLGSS